MPKSGDLDSTFSKTNVRFEISTFEIGYIRNFVKTLDNYFLAQNIQIWAFELEAWKSKANRKLQISSILKFWVISGRSTIFFLGRFVWVWVVSAGFGSFWLVSACFGLFQVLVSTIKNITKLTFTKVKF